MRKVLMMIQESCPYCKEALKIMEQLPQLNQIS